MVARPAARLAHPGRPRPSRHTCTQQGRAACCQYTPVQAVLSYHHVKSSSGRGNFTAMTTSFSAPGTRRRAQTCRCVRLEGLSCRPAQAIRRCEQLWQPVTTPERDGFQAAHHGVRQDVFVQPAHSRHLRYVLASAQQSSRCDKVLAS